MWKLALVALSLAFCGPSVATVDEIRRSRNTVEASYGDTTREQILETRNRRKRQLSVMVMDAKQKLADHSAGEITLTEEEKTQLENKVGRLGCRKSVNFFFLCSHCAIFYSNFVV